MPARAQQTAEVYQSQGGHSWTFGMFSLLTRGWLRAFDTFRPDVFAVARAAWAKRTSVWSMLPKDEQGNAHMGYVLCTQRHNTLVHATSRLVSLVGVSNLMVIETPDAMLVVDKACSHDVKQIVNALNQQKREEHSLHRTVQSPWGCYESVGEGSRFKVKSILVNPKASSNLQKHHHRAEHCLVVSETAEITNGNKVLLLSENQSTYIPLGEVHRLADPGSIPLEIIEAQSGSYLSEDDIVCIEYTYGRTGP